MKKLRLRLDELTVESFRTTSTEAGQGTVRGHHDDSTGCSYGGMGNFTGCDLTCYIPCGASDHCTPGCPNNPGTRVADSCGCGGSWDPTCQTGCDMTCEFAC